MAKVEAYEGYGYTLYRSEAQAIASYIFSAGQGAFEAVLGTSDPDYQPALVASILRAAELIKARKLKQKKRHCL